jgi:hypothetical protein
MRFYGARKNSRSSSAVRRSTNPNDDDEGCVQTIPHNLRLDHQHRQHRRGSTTGKTARRWFAMLTMLTQKTRCLCIAFEGSGSNRALVPCAYPGAAVSVA